MIRVDRQPTDAEARIILQSEDLRYTREHCATAVFRWPSEAEISLNTLGSEEGWLRALGKLAFCL